jgi:hypothetical protein
MTSSVVIVVVVVAVTLAAILFDPAHAQDDFYDSKIQSEWVDATLYCSNTTTPIPINDTDPVSWMLPNLTVLYFSSPKFIIQDNNWTLIIRNATADDLGQYHCLIPIKDGTDYYLVRLGLNAGGPYFEDLWEKYTTNTIIGLSVAGGFAVLCVCLYLLDRFRYRAPEEEEEDRDRKPVEIFYENNGRFDAVELGHHHHKEPYYEENGKESKGHMDMEKDNPVFDYDSVHGADDDGTKL